MTKPLFPGLAGISKQREITARKDTSLEQLAVIGKDAIRKYHTRTKPYNDKENYVVCEELTRKLDQTLPHYTANDLQGLVLAYANQKEPETKAIVRGMYTGILASQLTQRNQAQGKKTRIHLNGGDNSFPYLLYLAHALDEAIITNFCGDNILRYAASRDGHARTITLANITGDNAGAWIALNGRVDGVVTLANITGDWAGYSIAENGRVGVVTLANITGHNAGANIAWNGGRVGGIFVHKNEGNEHFDGCDVKRTPLHGHKNAHRAEILLARLKLEQDPEQLHATAQELAGILRQELESIRPQ